MRPVPKDAVINIRVPQSFKDRIVKAISNRDDYSITRVLLEGAEYVLKRLNKGKMNE